MRCAITDHKPIKSLWVFMGGICTEKVSSDYMDYMNVTAELDLSSMDHALGKGLFNIIQVYKPIPY